MFYTSDGVTEKNRVEIDVADIKGLMRWLEQAVPLAQGRNEPPTVEAEDEIDQPTVEAEEDLERHAERYD